jgi:RNA polymerase sigma-70 factor (ECF subfamily)
LLLASPDASPEVHAELAKLDRVLATIPANQQIAWMLRYVEGQMLEDVAQACNCSLATIKRRITAADARIRAHVGVNKETETAP